VSELLLAVDTTGEFGSIALLGERGLIEEVPLHSPDGFAHIIFDQIARLLARHHRTIMDIGCFGAAAGPGSFTGVRVGLACVKGLAEAAGRPAVGVSNLKAVASFGQGHLRAPLLDARRGEVYGAVYDAGLNLVMPEVVTKFAAWAAALPIDAEVISTDIGPFVPMLSGRPALQAPRALAGAVGRIAWLEWKQARAQDPAALDANYVRRSDAELFWKDG
jgi:tRNA threonylcarbamoyladenosine biosynthesis protein TsaB